MSKKGKSGVVSRRDFIKKGAVVGLGSATLGGLVPKDLGAARVTFDRSADVVVVGAGVSGLAACIRAADNKAKVIAVEANFDIGGHGMLSGGNVSLGGGTSLQQKYGIKDSADSIYLDHTRPETMANRYNDRDIVRAFADNNLAVFNFLNENGVVFPDEKPVLFRDATIPRQQTTTVAPGGFKVSINGRNGSGLVRALEASARQKGVEFLLQHRMTSIVREEASSGRVLGITATNQGKTVKIGAKKGVIITTGGHSANVDFRRMFDSRLTEEYSSAGEPWTQQNAEGEKAALQVGASLWGTANQTSESGLAITKTIHIGCKNGYRNLKWNPQSPVFDKAGASGLSVDDFQDVILVNMLGKRFWNEIDESYNFLAACLGSVVLDGGKTRLGGPIWAIFDADAVKREYWVPAPPNVDLNGYFFTANTIAELAPQFTKNPHQKVPMPADALEKTVTKYNSYVDAGKDSEFNRPTPKYKIQTPPFYAAWSTPILHDTLAGLRVNASYQVIDHRAQVIPGLFAAGESASGFALHGLAKCLVSGYIAGGTASVGG